MPRPKPKYDMRKQSVYLPSDILESVKKIQELQDISISRIISDCFRLIAAQPGKIDWDVARVVMKKKEFKEAMR